MSMSIHNKAISLCQVIEKYGKGELDNISSDGKTYIIKNIKSQIYSNTEKYWKVLIYNRSHLNGKPKGEIIFKKYFNKVNYLNVFF